MKELIRQIACGICRALGGQESVPYFAFSGVMDIHELSSILIDKFPDVPIYLPDSYYKVCTKQDVERFLAWDNTNKLKYTGDPGLDCDDFAWRLKGNITIPQWNELPFAVVWTNLHALNGFVGSDGNWWFVEPQNNQIQEELESWQGSELRFIAM